MKCIHDGCAYTSTSAFSVRRHELRCLFRKSDRTDKRTKASESAGAMSTENMGDVQYSGEQRRIGLGCDINQVVMNNENSASVDDDKNGDAGSSLCEGRLDPTSTKRGELTDIYNYFEWDVMTAIVRLSRSAGQKQVNAFLNIVRRHRQHLSTVFEKASSVAACRDHLQSEMMDEARREGFDVVDVKDHTHGSKGTVYMKNNVTVLQKQVSFVSPDEFTFRPKYGTNQRIREPMETAAFNEMYCKRRDGVIRSTSKSTYWVDSSVLGIPSFVGFVQIYSDKSAMTLKSNAMVVYPVHAVFLNTTAECRRRLIDGGHTLVGFLPVDIGDTCADDDVYEDGMDTDDVVPLEETVRATSERDARERKLQVLHSSLLAMLNPLVQCAIDGFKVVTVGNNVWNCFPILSSFCSDIPEGKDMSAIRHGTMGSKPCIRCNSSMENFKSLYTASNRSLENTITIRQGGLNMSKKDYGELLKQENLSIVPSFVEELWTKSPHLIPDGYGIFTFESLHNLHLGISKLVKNCLLAYLDGDVPTSVLVDGQRRNRTRSAVQTSVLSAMNAILREIETKYPGCMSTSPGRRNLQD